MDELRLLFLLLQLVYRLVRGIIRMLWGIGRFIVTRLAAKLRFVPAGTAPIPKRSQPRASTGGKGGRAPAPQPAPRPAVDPALVAKLGAQVQELMKRAGALEDRCDADPLCAPLRPTLRDFVTPKLASALAEVRKASSPGALREVASLGAYLDALLRLLSLMADQRVDPSLDELIDDADTLAEACYRPVVDYCRTNDVPLSSDRTATVFGDDCSPWLGRIDDPTGLAILHLPWSWLAEVHRWPAIGHEVGHDFYDSVAGLDEELVRRLGLVDALDDPAIVDGRYGVSQDDVDRLVAVWRQELAADAFGVMMLGPAYAVTTMRIFARPDEPVQALAVSVDGDEYEVHPPGHVRVAVVCRLLGRMGYGKIADQLEQRWRAQHKEPRSIFLPSKSTGWIRIEDAPFIERSLDVATALYRDGFTALRGIPLASMPGFDFGPREHEGALRIQAAFLGGAAPSTTDARLLIAGAVLAFDARPNDNARLLRAARLAVGKLPLPVAKVPGLAGRGPGAPTREILRDAILLDAILTPRNPLLQRR
jgi:hypothetical protein